MGGPAIDTEAAIYQLEMGLQRSAVCAVLRHDGGDAVSGTSDVILQLVPAGSVGRTVKKMAEDGFASGPTINPELLLREGQVLTVRFRGNVVSSENSITVS